jgi:phosphoserine phosphatase
MRLVLVRHGESTWNAEGRYQGRMDPPLSTRGRAQAQALAARVVREQSAGSPQTRMTLIVSSPLSRARDTAQACADALALDLATDERLTEISHGDWEGKLRGEVAIRWPDMLAQWRSNPHLVQFPHGEMLEEVELRLRSFLHSLRDETGTVLAVTHDVIVRIAVLLASGKELSSFNEVHIDNAALNEFTLEGGKLRLLHVNDTTHLGSLRSDTAGQAL